MQPSGAVSKAAPAFAKVAPSAPPHGPLAPSGGLLFPPSDLVAQAAMLERPSAPPAPAFFGPLGGSLNKLPPGGGSFEPMLDMAPPGPPPGMPFGGEASDPPGPPAGLPPGFPPVGMPFMEAMPPLGFPPGMEPSAGLSVRAFVENLSEGANVESASPPEIVAKAPPGSPPREKPEVKKRKKGVEGLASNKAIKNGGAVTIYAGYDAVTVAPKAPDASEKPSQPAQITGGGVTQGLQRQLPPGWEMRKSRSTGKVYYVNEKLGKSQFDPPAGSTIDKQAEKKKKKVTARSKDIPDAQFTDRGGMLGLMRANEQKKGRWAKWQKCNEILNEPDPEEANLQDDAPRWKGKGKGKGKRRDDDDD
ncbi:unnamed protein product [Durusdinium trenchii]|uniref:WW domain-containing protein n=1 Tax=Durusdinium trenchii TaxID=1381693 RepID=A0ABP0PVG5_9DINO